MIDSADLAWLVGSYITAWCLGYGLGAAFRTFRQAGDVIS